MLAELDRITMTLHSGVHEVASADAMFVQTEKLVERRPPSGLPAARLYV
jgi:hypothetical protein